MRIILLFILIVTPSFFIAQSEYFIIINSYDGVSLTQANSDTITDPLSLMEHDSLEVVSSVHIPDLDSISEIHVEIGRTYGADDVVLENYSSIDSNNLPSSFIYNSLSRQLLIIHGVHPHVAYLYGEIKITLLNGTVITLTYNNLN